MSSTQSYGYDAYLKRRQESARASLQRGFETISPEQIYSAELAFQQMRWKINNLRLTREEYTEWKGFVDAIAPLFPDDSFRK